MGPRTLSTEERFVFSGPPETRTSGKPRITSRFHKTRDLGPHVVNDRRLPSVIPLGKIN